jgi:hypothetical protein
MPETFNCPTCGAPLDYQNNGETTVRCPFCNNSVIVPETLHTQKDIDPPAIFSSIDQTAHLPEIAEIGQLIRAGKKIEAIKIYRQAFNTDLLTAKNAIEAMEHHQPVQINRIDSNTTFDFHTLDASAQLPPVAPVGKTRGFRLGCVLSAVILLFLVGLGLAFVWGNTPTSRSVTNGDSQQALPQALATGKAQLQGLTENLPSFGDATLLLSFGEKGIGPGQFQDARSVAVDPQGNIYLGEYEGGRILVFDSAGKYSAQWNTGDRKAPLRSLAVDRSGILYLAENGNLLKFKGQTGELMERSKTGSVEDYFDFVTVTPDGGNLRIASGENVQMFDAQGKQTLKIPAAISSISDNSELDTHAAVDGNGNIYLLGSFNNAVFKYSPQGKYLNQFGGDGDNAGQFRAPEQITVDGLGRVFVSDIKGVQIFDTNGRYLGLIKVAGAAFGVTVDDQNNLYVITNSPKVYKFKVTVMP